jgi:Icc-related predicted phosphoesterase
MRVCCLSDLHGHLPEVPECDLLLLGGDYCSRGYEPWWYRDTLAPWLAGLSKRMTVIGVAGNHDFVFERSPHLVPEMAWTYLQDSGTTFRGMNVWGSPWQPRFYDWAFNADEPELERVWAKIPQGTDILLLHGPPRGYGDRSRYRHNHEDDTTWPGYEHAGSPSLTARIEVVKPRLVVCGHIHADYGRYQLGNTIVVNAAYVGEQYQPAHEPVLVDL